MVNIKEFLDGLKLNYRETNTHFQVDCPLCTDTRKRLGISKDYIGGKGKDKDHAWQCLNCNSKALSLKNLKSAIDKLKKLNRKEFVEFVDDKPVAIKSDLGHRCHEILKTKKDALKYIIQERKLSKECIKHFGLGFRSKFKNSKGEVYDAGPHISIPYYENGKLVNLKYRSIDPNVSKEFKWRREQGGKTALFNSDATDCHDYNEIIIAEAEIDAMSIWSNGYENVVSLTAGAGNFKQEWADRLERFDKIYLLLDNDKAGEKGNKELAKRLGYGRCYKVSLPEGIKDANDYFKEHSAKDFQGLLNSAKRYEIEKVVPLKNAIASEIRRIKYGEIEDQGLTTGFKVIDKLMGLMQEGNYIVLCARPKVGKTRFLINVLNNLANRGIHTFNVQCEMTERDLLRSYIALNTCTPMPDFNSIENKNDLMEAKEEAIEALSDGYIDIPIFNLLSYHPTGMDLDVDSICEKIKQVTQRFGTKIVGIDNMHFLCRGAEAKSKIDEASQKFKTLAVELGIVIIVVTHPKKTNHDRELDNDDLKDSSSMFQDADGVILLHREKKSEADVAELQGDNKDMVEEGAMQDFTFVKITARRKSGGKCKLAYIPQYSIFKEDGKYFNDLLDLYKRQFKTDEE